MDFNTVCDRCHYPLGNHKTVKLGWSSNNGDGTYADIEFWQEGFCPDIHNQMQPSWDYYVFQYIQNGELVFPYENVGRQKMSERRKMRAARNG